MWTLDSWGLLSAFAQGDLVGHYPSPDSLLADFAGNLRLSSEFGEASACLYASAGDTSSSGLRSGLLSIRWPGTPWIGGYAGVSRPGLFAPGLYEPLVEHGWFGPESLFSLGLTSGGFLGTRVEIACFALPNDTLDLLSIRSPWLGFGAVEYWSCGNIDSAGLPSSVRSLSGVLDLRAVRPWFLLASTGSGSDSGAVLVELRGATLLSHASGKLMLTPRAVIAGDSAEAPGGAFRAGQRTVGGALEFYPTTRAVSWSAEGEYDLDDPGDSRGSGRFFLLSQAGMEYLVEAGDIGQGRPSSRLRVVYRREGASAGADLAAVGDSVRVTGLFGYSPLHGVSSLLSVSADADDSPEPSISLETAVGYGNVQGMLRLDREGGETSITLAARAVLR